MIYQNVWRFTVHGLPVAQPRPRFTKKGYAYTPAKHPVNEWRRLVELAALADGPFEPIEASEAIHLMIDFEMPRPKNRIWKTRLMPRLWHVRRPDIDNLCKSTIDGMTGICFQDDNQIARLTTSKYVAEGVCEPRAIITIQILED